MFYSIALLLSSLALAVNGLIFPIKPATPVGYVSVYCGDGCTAYGMIQGVPGATLNDIYYFDDAGNLVKVKNLDLVFYGEIYYIRTGGRAASVKHVLANQRTGRVPEVCQQGGRPYLVQHGDTLTGIIAENRPVSYVTDPQGHYLPDPNKLFAGETLCLN